MSNLPSSHIHEYIRSATSKVIYKCVHPDCTHYHQKEYLIGKRALCGECKNPFLLTKLQLKNKKPRCEFCKDTPEARALKAANEGLVDFLDEELEKAGEI